MFSALAGYEEDSDGSGELDEGKEADQHLMTNNALRKTVYIASMTQLYLYQLSTIDVSYISKHNNVKNHAVDKCSEQNLFLFIHLGCRWYKV